MAMKKVALMMASMFVFAGAVHASDSVDLKVTGTLTNNSCIPAIADGGVVDLAHIPVKNMTKEGTIGYILSANQHKKIDVTITCTVDTSVAVTLTDNNAGTVPPSFSSYRGTYGLGKNEDDKDIGLFQLYSYKVLIDGAESGIVSSANQGATWNSIGTNSALPPNGTYYSFSSTGSAVPKAGKVFKMTMDTTYYFEKSVVDEMQDDIPFEGKATFTLVYL